jgi:hypothetical protein
MKSVSDRLGLREYSGRSGVEDAAKSLPQIFRG